MPHAIAPCSGVLREQLRRRAVNHDRLRALGDPPQILGKITWVLATVALIGSM
jgi:hypothetical protein